MTSAWTQPICPWCWDRRWPDRQPLRLADPDPETCCFCGSKTLAGIYIRVDPETVPHPRTPT